MKTDVWLGVVTILPNLIGLLMTIYPPTKRQQRASLALLFVVLAAAGILLVVKQSGETESASKRAEEEWKETQAAAERTVAQTKQQLQEMREYSKREKDENSHLLATMEGMDKTLQLLRKSVASPELQRQADQAHRHYVKAMSEHLQTGDSLRAEKNPTSAQPQE